MTILETFLKITPMLYVSMVMLPIMLYGYLVTSKSKKRVAAALANPADQLRVKRIDVRREFTSALFLGGCIAFGAAIIFFTASIVIDFKNSSGLFAVPLAPATFPPAPNNMVYPPEPVFESDAGAAANANQTNPAK